MSAQAPPLKPFRFPLAFRVSMLLVLALPVLVMSTVSTGGSTEADSRPVIGIEHRGDIRAVVQVTSGEVSEGLHKGLLKLRMIADGYVEAGVPVERLDIRAVFHGSAADFVLADEAWNRVRGESGGNPNAALISELGRKGVHLELCNNRRLKNGWEKADVHPEVGLASSAYHRILDLQHRGYAYVRL